MNVYVTGSNGFIGKNISIFLKENNFNIIEFNKSKNLKKTFSNIKSGDVIIHLAGQNRSEYQNDFYKNNIKLTKLLSDILIKKKTKCKFIFSSTLMNSQHKEYLISKIECEKILKKMSKKTLSKLVILRLPNIFGKWSKPNHNSAVATFCYNINRLKQIKISNPKKKINLLYIDDLMQIILKIINSKKSTTYPSLKPQTIITVKDLVNKIKLCKKIFDEDIYFNIKDNFLKKLYSTYLSFAPIKKITKKKPFFTDKRGSFSEFIKKEDFGQVSVLNINKNKIRGNHYHNTKVEKFLIISGKVLFKLENFIKNDKISIILEPGKKNFIQIPPGWSHNIQNICNKISTLVIWANEIYDVKFPDTFKKRIK